MRRPRTFSASLDGGRYPIPINGVSFYSCCISICRYLCCLPQKNLPEEDDNSV